MQEAPPMQPWRVVVEASAPAQPQAPQAERQHQASRCRPSRGSSRTRSARWAARLGRPGLQALDHAVPVDGSGSGCRASGSRARSACVSASMSGSRTGSAAAPALVSQCPSIAAILAGWCSSVLRPCRSPATIWIGATNAAIHIAMENITRAPRVGAVAQQVAGADGADHEGGGEVGGEHHVHEPIGKRRVEDDRPPVRGHELAGGVDGVAGGRLHPAVGGQDPERRHAACRLRPSAWRRNAARGRRAPCRTA